VAANERKKLSDTLSVDLQKVHAALFARRWEAGAGLYHGNVGDAATISTHARFTPLGIQSRFAGVRVSFHGIEFDLIFDAFGLGQSDMIGKVHRPGELVFETPRYLDAVLLTWTNELQSQSVRMNRRSALKCLMSHGFACPTRGGEIETPLAVASFVYN
jgi:hypothetical protein